MANNRYEQWLAELTEDERDQVTVLNAYFDTRSNTPGESEIKGKHLAPEYKTTQDIIDELMPMMAVSPGIVSKYLLLQGYTMATYDDGTVKWAIWRDIDMAGQID